MIERQAQDRATHGVDEANVSNDCVGQIRRPDQGVEVLAYLKDVHQRTEWRGDSSALLGHGTAPPTRYAERDPDQVVGVRGKWPRSTGSCR
jgi:hypothetical protein